MGGFLSEWQGSAFPGVKKSGEPSVSSRPGPGFKASQRGLTTLGTEPTRSSGGCLEPDGSLGRKHCLPRGPDTARPVVLALPTPSLGNQNILPRKQKEKL